MEWHSGVRPTVEELRRRPEYRGQDCAGPGAEIAVGGRLDPRVIGEPARTGHYDPQALKKVWHYEARFSAPRTA